MAQSTAKSRAMLNLHPSVQDLNIQYGGINLFKTNIHKMLINNGPLHDNTPSVHKVCATEATGQRVTVVKNGCSPGKPIPIISTHSKKEHLYTKSSCSPPFEDTMSPIPGSAHSKSDNVNITSAVTPNHKGDTSPSLSHEKKMTTRVSNTQPSLVSTEISYDSEGCSDCETSSLYSCCSCCAKPSSTVASAATSASMVNLSAYDNMTSVSQRTNRKHSTTSSVLSSKLQSLKEELEMERKNRIQTQEKLDEIRRRQAELMSMLPYEERKHLENIMSANPIKRKKESGDCHMGNYDNEEINKNCHAYRNKKMQVIFKSRLNDGPFEVEDGDSLFL